MKLIPIGERVVIKSIQSDGKTKSGIYLPKSEDKKQGIIVELGAFKENISLKVGDKILYGGYSSEEFEVEGEKYLIIELKDILAKFEE